MFIELIRAFLCTVCRAAGQQYGETVFYGTLMNLSTTSLYHIGVAVKILNCWPISLPYQLQIEAHFNFYHVQRVCLSICTTFTCVHVCMTKTSTWLHPSLYRTVYSTARMRTTRFVTSQTGLRIRARTRAPYEKIRVYARTKLVSFILINYCH